MAGLIMMGLIALMVIGTILTFFMSKGWKKALYTFISFLVIIGLFILYTNKACGPNAKDVEIMTPQAEAISNYILENGLPNSLAEIPNLPYKLVDCKRTLLYKQYRKSGYTKRYYEDRNKTNAQGEVLKEICTFKHDGRHYSVNIRFSATYKDDLNTDESNQFIGTFSSNTFQGGQGELVFYNEKTETGIDYFYNFDLKLHKWIYELNIGNNPNIYSAKDDGICNTMRQ